MKIPEFARACAIAGIALLGTNGSAGAETADNAPLLILGVQGSSASSYSYAGVIKPMAGATLGQGWFSQVMASWLTYRYQSTDQNNASVEVHGTAPAIEAGVGYGWKTDQLSTTLSGMAGYRHIRRSPDVGSGSPQGGVATFTPQLQMSYSLSKSTRAELATSYTFGEKNFFSRVRAHTALNESGLRAGVEAAYLRGPDYRSQQGGLFVTTSVAPGIGLILDVGIARDQNAKKSFYAGISLARSFGR